MAQEELRLMSVNEPNVNMERPKRPGLRRALVGTIAALLAVAATTACGSSTGATTKQAVSSVSGIAQAGSGLTKPTSPSGARVTGGTVTFAEAPGSAPNYIFPGVSAQYCSIANVTNFNVLMYRPLYWYGNNYTPTVDYDYSIGDQPVWSNDDKTVTIPLKDWKWSDGEQVTSRDVEFYINLYKANRADNCEYVPGRFPDNVVSLSAPNASTLVLHLNASYDPEWFLYNELSQLVPLPLAWDRTSPSQAASTSDNGHLPDSTPAGARAVYKFLDAQSKDMSTWTTSPLWTVVDGPWKLQSFTSVGQATLVPNPDYSGSPKPSIAKFVELPYTSDTAAFNEFRAGGPSAVTIGYVPPQDVPAASKLTAAGYLDNQGSMYSFSFFPLNYNNPTVGPIFKQLYVRQALQHLVDQNGWISAFLGHAATVTASPVPSTPPSPLVNGSTSVSPYPFSVSAASKLLSQNGWKVIPSGTTTCETPGTGSGDCGAGIRKGEPLSFSLAYASGSTSLASEMNDLEAQAKQVGITINLTVQAPDQLTGAAVPCTPSQPLCKWQAADWGSGWVYADPYLPTGEVLFATGATTNFGSYSSSQANTLIDKTISAPASQEADALSAYSAYMAKQLPVIYQPTSIGLYSANAGTLVSDKLGGFSANAFTYLTPEAWYLVK
jgi:peptide/nickel transport system substrate-binding protein